MAKRVRLIYNPSSGREEIKRRLPDILHRLEAGGLETSTHATIGAGDAAKAAADAVERGFDIIVSAGGDGTLNEIVSGIAEKSHRPPIGILPVGTTNDFARALSIPRQWQAACDLIIKQHTRLIDVGKVHERYFINIAAGGSMTELTYEVPSKMKTIMGQLAYYVKSLEKLPRLKPIKLHIKTAEMEIQEQVMLFLIANSNSVAGFEKLAPQASLDDGFFDILILKKCNIGEFFRVVTSAARGDHLKDPKIIYIKTNHIQITSPDYVQINLDGEFGGILPCEFSMIPSHLSIIVDESGNSTYHSH